ncbi:DUF4136 domain-containing protein [Algibacter mikhailovii]|uniref:DUF4136 domain-containing protein n=1 Tax=Algibacter mikhailovii TaxID=425498 RepID=A0A918QYD5_9FLAO|nr:DUF4136 domain-containing protein [Algibacter mikhailovii]GGZ79368.1 hypothetical protein GCM10007028_16150 [Algibacter mikhailovii]
MRLFLIAAVLLLVSCAPIRVNYDYDRTTNFENYRTYQYFADMNTGLSELDTSRLLDALDAKMTEKGYSISKTPDFFIDIKSKSYQEGPKSTVGIGMGGTSGNVGGGVSVGIPVGQGNISREITIDFVDHNKKQLFWQSVSESSFNPNASPEERSAMLKAIVDKVLYQYPPEDK